MKNVDTLSVIATAFFFVTLSTKDLVWKSTQNICSACLLELTTKVMLEETTNLYMEDKTIETTQQTFNSFGKRIRKRLQDKTVEEVKTKLHVLFYWKTLEKIVAIHNRN